MSSAFDFILHLTNDVGHHHETRGVRWLLSLLHLLYLLRMFLLQLLRLLLVLLLHLLRSSLSSLLFRQLLMLPCPDSAGASADPGSAARSDLPAASGISGPASGCPC